MSEARQFCYINLNGWLYTVEERMAVILIEAVAMT
jgi:hypothetical protein